MTSTLEREEMAQQYRPRRNMAHPGEVLGNWLESEGRSQTWLAERVDVSLKHVNRIIRGHARYSPELAVKLGRITNISAREWMYMQADWDLVEVYRSRRRSPSKADTNASGTPQT